MAYTPLTKNQVLTKVKSGNGIKLEDIDDTKFTHGDDADASLKRNREHLQKLEKEGTVKRVEHGRGTTETWEVI